MNAAERLETFQRGFNAVAMVAAELVERFGEQPEDPSMGRLLGDVHGVVCRLAIVLAVEGEDDRSAEIRDGIVHVNVLHWEDEVLARCEELLRQASPYRDEGPPAVDTESVQALQGLRSLLRRYSAGEFVPSFAGLRPDPQDA